MFIDKITATSFKMQEKFYIGRMDSVAFLSLLQNQP